MTVADLEATMTTEEELEWVEYHRLVAEEREKSMKEASRNSAKARR
jgi:hypothetical protein